MNFAKQDFDLILEPGQSEKNYWLDLWRFRDLFYILTWRDIKVRYKQTAIGVFWSILRPVLTMIVFVVVFGKIAQLPSEGVPYPILVFSAIIPWQFFSTSMSESGGSLVANSQLISKVYFPRIIIPISSIIVNLVDFLISFGLLIILFVVYSHPVTWRIVTIPFLTGIAFLAAFSTGVLIAALNVKFRDFRYIIPFIVQFGLFVSPVGFSSSVVPEKWQLAYSLNPMVGVIDGFRWALIGQSHKFPWTSVGISLLTIALLLFASISYFRRTERKFADVI